MATKAQRLKVAYCEEFQNIKSNEPLSLSVFVAKKHLFGAASTFDFQE